MRDCAKEDTALCCAAVCMPSSPAYGGTFPTGKAKTQRETDGA